MTPHLNVDESRKHIAVSFENDDYLSFEALLIKEFCS